MKRWIIAALVANTLTAWSQEASLPMTYAEAVRRAAARLDVPSAPPSLQLQPGHSTPSLTPKLGALRVRRTYLDALWAHERLAQLDDVQHEAELCVQQSERQRAAGDAPPFDVEQLRSFELRSEEATARAQGEEEITQARLTNVLGYATGTRFSLAEHLLPLPDPALAQLDDPTGDVASRARTLLATGPNWGIPQKTVGSDTSLGLRMSTQQLPSVNYGLALLSTSFAFSGPSSSATTNVAESAAQLDVEESLLSLQSAQTSFKLASRSVDHASEALRLAKIRYTVGASPASELVSALALLTDGRMRMAQAAYEEPLARARLSVALSTP